jgi:dTDP-4-amino-4,6-dideoxygalactose transaminase
VTKNITTIEGGAVVTADPGLASEVEQAALHGLSAGAWRRYSDAGIKHYEATSRGYKFNMTDVQAALGIHQLPHLDEWIDRRADRWAQYDAALADLPLASLRLPIRIHVTRATCIRCGSPMTRPSLATTCSMRYTRIESVPGSTTARFTCRRTTAIGTG